MKHIECALARLAKERPVFAGRLHATSSGRVDIYTSPINDIPFQVLPSDEPIADDYEQMKDEAFPPGTFIHPRFAPSGSIEWTQEPVPVSKVQLGFVNGGLLLSIYLHHGLVDGGSLNIFLESFAAQTRDFAIDLPSQQAFPATNPRSQKPQTHIRDGSIFKRLLAGCPEYAWLSDYSGPTQPRLVTSGQKMSHIERIGRIFVFRTERLRELREHVRLLNGLGVLPSAYTTLAALSFAHITKARTQAEKDILGGEPQKTAMLWNSVNWRTRAFKGMTENYFGNAALPAVTKVSMRQLMEACHDDYELAQIVPTIKASIDAIDQQHVSRRLAMLSQAPDPRVIGVNYDPRMPSCLAFNTWRHFGADHEWSIPGVPVAKPDAIRRAHGSWNLGTALILPARADAPKQELFVSMSVGAMNLLCADERWMRWVDSVIG